MPVVRGAVVVGNTTVVNKPEVVGVASIGRTQEIVVRADI